MQGNHACGAGTLSFAPKSSPPPHRSLHDPYDSAVPFHRVSTTPVRLAETAHRGRAHAVRCTDLERHMQSLTQHVAQRLIRHGGTANNIMDSRLRRLLSAQLLACPRHRSPGAGQSGSASFLTRREKEEVGTSMVVPPPPRSGEEDGAPVRGLKNQHLVRRVAQPRARRRGSITAAARTRKVQHTERVSCRANDEASLQTHVDTALASMTPAFSAAAAAAPAPRPSRRRAWAEADATAAAHAVRWLDMASLAKQTRTLSVLPAWQCRRDTNSNTRADDTTPFSRLHSAPSATYTFASAVTTEDAEGDDNTNNERYLDAARRRRSAVAPTRGGHCNEAYNRHESAYAVAAYDEEKEATHTSTRRRPFSAQRSPGESATASSPLRTVKATPCGGRRRRRVPDCVAGLLFDFDMTEALHRTGLALADGDACHACEEEEEEDEDEAVVLHGQTTHRIAKSCVCEVHAKAGMTHTSRRAATSAGNSNVYSDATSGGGHVRHSHKSAHVFARELNTSACPRVVPPASSCSLAANTSVSSLANVLLRRRPPRQHTAVIAGRLSSGHTCAVRVCAITHDMLVQITEAAKSGCGVAHSVTAAQARAKCAVERTCAARWMALCCHALCMCLLPDAYMTGRDASQTDVYANDEKSEEYDENSNANTSITSTTTTTTTNIKNDVCTRAETGVHATRWLTGRMRRWWTVLQPHLTPVPHTDCHTDSCSRGMRASPSAMEDALLRRHAERGVSGVGNTPNQLPATQLYTSKGELANESYMTPSYRSAGLPTLGIRLCQVERRGACSSHYLLSIATPLIRHGAVCVATPEWFAHDVNALPAAWVECGVRDVVAAVLRALQRRDGCPHGALHVHNVFYAAHVDAAMSAVAASYTNTTNDANDRISSYHNSDKDNSKDKQEEEGSAEIEKGNVPMTGEGDVLCNEELENKEEEDAATAPCDDVVLADDVFVCVEKCVEWAVSRMVCAVAAHDLTSVNTVANITHSPLRNDTKACVGGSSTITATNEDGENEKDDMNKGEELHFYVEAVSASIPPPCCITAMPQPGVRDDTSLVASTAPPTQRPQQPAGEWLLGCPNTHRPRARLSSACDVWALGTLALTLAEVADAMLSTSHSARSPFFGSACAPAECLAHLASRARGSGDESSTSRVLTTYYSNSPLLSLPPRRWSSAFERFVQRCVALRPCERASVKALCDDAWWTLTLVTQRCGETRPLFRGVVADMHAWGASLCCARWLPTSIPWRAEAHGSNSNTNQAAANVNTNSSNHNNDNNSNNTNMCTVNKTHTWNVCERSKNGLSAAVHVPNRVRRRVITLRNVCMCAAPLSTPKSATHVSAPRCSNAWINNSNTNNNYNISSSALPGESSLALPEHTQCPNDSAEAMDLAVSFTRPWASLCAPGWGQCICNCRCNVTCALCRMCTRTPRFLGAHLVAHDGHTYKLNHAIHGPCALAAAECHVCETCLLHAFHHGVEGSVSIVCGTSAVRRHCCRLCERHECDSVRAAAAARSHLTDHAVAQTSGTRVTCAHANRIRGLDDGMRAALRRMCMATTSTTMTPTGIDRSRHACCAKRRQNVVCGAHQGDETELLRLGSATAAAHTVPTPLIGQADGVRSNAVPSASCCSSPHASLPPRHAQRAMLSCECMMHNMCTLHVSDSMRINSSSNSSRSSSSSSRRMCSPSSTQSSQSLSSTRSSLSHTACHSSRPTSALGRTRAASAVSLAAFASAVRRAQQRGVRVPLTASPTQANHTFASLLTHAPALITDSDTRSCSSSSLRSSASAWSHSALSRNTTSSSLTSRASRTTSTRSGHSSDASRSSREEAVCSAAKEQTASLTRPPHTRSGHSQSHDDTHALPPPSSASACVRLRPSTTQRELCAALMQSFWTLAQECPLAADLWVAHILHHSTQLDDVHVVTHDMRVVDGTGTREGCSTKIADHALLCPTRCAARPDETTRRVSAPREEHEDDAAKHNGVPGLARHEAVQYEQTARAKWPSPSHKEDTWGESERVECGGGGKGTMQREERHCCAAGHTRRGVSDVSPSTMHRLVAAKWAVATTRLLHGDMDGGARVSDADEDGSR